MKMFGLCPLLKGISMKPTEIFSQPLVFADEDNILLVAGAISSKCTVAEAHVVWREAEGKSS